MPYIEQRIKTTIDPKLKRIINSTLTEGELNYAITKLCISYIEHHALNYTSLNAIVGALECAKLEFYRRLVGPYEDEKIKFNGDVY
ncbi:MAG TPA: hypothetical protein VI911_10235 [Patescibacteria group bacterium]|nr:hypothetical protein [Patescibacteria group bacterium]